MDSRVPLSPDELDALLEGSKHPLCDGVEVDGGWMNHPAVPQLVAILALIQSRNILYYYILFPPP